MIGKHWVLEAMKSIIVGAVTGVFMMLFANTVAFLGDLNEKWPYLVLLLPFGALLTAGIYKRFGESYRAITAVAIDYIHDGEEIEAGHDSHMPSMKISPMMGCVAFLSAAIAHFSGASVGKEGAGVQIGLSIGELGYRIDKRFSKDRQPGDYYLMAGASAAFGALFSAPVAGTIFGMTFASPDIIRLTVLLPCLLSSFSAVFVSQLVGIHGIKMPEVSPMPVNGETVAATVLLAVLIGLSARLFVFLLERFKDEMGKRFENPTMRVVVPSTLAAVIFLATYIITGRDDYNGLSLTLLYDSINGNGVPMVSFLIKAILVFLSIAAGFVGGEVVPLLVTGGTFGYAFGTLFSLDAAPFAVFGAIGMLSGGTNLPLVCFALGLELFGYNEPMLLFLAISISFIASGKKSIYQHQRNALRRRLKSNPSMK